jgi:osmotically-inducible protein OsmY
MQVSKLLIIFMGAVFANFVSANSLYNSQADRRSTQTMIVDDNIDASVRELMAENKGFLKGWDVRVFNRRVVLVGSSSDPLKIKEVGESVKKIKNSSEVINLIEKSDFEYTPSIDDLIRNDLNSAFKKINNIPHESVRPLVYNQKVYLLGIVTIDEANLIVEITRRHPKVKQVTRIFDLISDSDKLKQKDSK